ncbi:MAG TPA: hypothetical protein VEA92_00260 [Candidatus Paceibacterota bacterium]|nr:hypothetical protein [Candidatus Paceibacterota bacterium]
MNSTFAIALGVPARHIEVISTARSKLMAELGSQNYDQRWYSWIPVCITTRLQPHDIEKLSDQFKKLPASAIIPSGFSNRGTFLAVEFSGADSLIERLQGIAMESCPSADLMDTPAYVPLLTSCVPGAIAQAYAMATESPHNLVLPQTALSLSDLLFYRQDGERGWRQLTGTPTQKLAA